LVVDCCTWLGLDCSVRKFSLLQHQKPTVASAATGKQLENMTKFFFKAKKIADQ